jgi:putative ABC transport system permease protein
MSTRDADREMDEEMRLHVALLAEQNRAAGMDPVEARRAALVRFGPAEALQERARAQRPLFWLADLGRDAAYVLRTLRRRPGFAAVVVATLALGIGACAAIFSAVNGVLLRALPYPGSERLVVVKETFLPRFPELAVSPGHYFDWRERATSSFESLAAVQMADGIPGREGSYNLTGRGEPARVSAARVTANTFATLRTPPALGRDFSPDDDRPGRSDVAILSHGFWMRRLGGRADAVGQALTLNGRPFTVIGVMPAGFELDRPVDLFTPAAFSEAERRDRGGSHVFDVLGRLRPGVSLAQARRELTLLANRLAEEDPATSAHTGVIVSPMLEARVTGARAVLLSLLGAVGLLLLIACANVAHLMLARAAARSQEIAVRVALGADRPRIVRQLLTESALLALAGAALGLLVAHVAVSALAALAPDSLPRAREIAVDGPVLGFTAALALAAALGFGLAPALAAARIDLHRALKEGGRGATGGRRHQQARGALVAAEVAIALVLLVGAGLLIRSFARLVQVRPGFEPQGAVALRVALSPAKYPGDPERAAFADAAVRRIAALPGAAAVAAVDALPFSGDVINIVALKVAGRAPPADYERPTAHVFSVTPGYFAAMGIPLVRGRAFNAHDDARAPPVTIVSRTLAARLFPGEDPIGKRIDAVRDGPDRWHEIVGVVGDVKLDRLDGDAVPEAYAPFAQGPSGTLTFVVRGAAPAAPTKEARAALAAVDPDQAVASVHALGELVARAVARQRFAMLLFAVFSAAALLLAAVGVYGVVAYAVAQRTGEIGVRMAFGARTIDVVGLVLRQGGRLVAVGLTAGIGGALALTRLLGSMLFGVSPYDPLTFAAIAALLTLVAALACAVPAYRAARVDPATVLRAE